MGGLVVSLAGAVARFSSRSDPLEADAVDNDTDRIADQVPVALPVIRGARWFGREARPFVLRVEVPLKSEKIVAALPCGLRRRRLVRSTGEDPGTARPVPAGVGGESARSARLICSGLQCLSSRPATNWRSTGSAFACRVRAGPAA